MSAIFNDYTKSLNTVLAAPPSLTTDTVLIGAWAKWETGQAHGSGNYVMDLTNDGSARVSLVVASASQVLAFGGWNGAVSLGNTTMVDGEWYLHAGLLSPNLSSPAPSLGVSKNGAALQTIGGAYTAGETTNLSAIRIGQKGKSSSAFTNWKGKVAEVFAFRVADVAEANLLLAELATKTPDTCVNGELLWYAPLHEDATVSVGDALTNNASVTFDAADHPTLSGGNMTVPDAPTIGTATAGYASASVAFTAPASNGGSQITEYTATSTPDGIIGTGASSPVIVEGLTPGTSYTFTVRATNGIGDSAESASSNSVIPAVPPPAPTGTITTQHAPDGQSVRFELTATDATSGTYTLTGSNGGVTVGPLPFDVIDGVADFTVDGIASGDYAVTLTVTGAGGTSQVTGTSPFSIIGVSGGGEITTTAGGGDTTVPTLTGSIAVSSVTGTGMILSWVAGSDDTAVTGYEYSINGGSSWINVGNTLSVEVAGLTENTSYPVRVRAYDAAGNRSTPALATTVTTEPPDIVEDTTAPVLSGSITVTSVGTDAVSFSWPAGTDDTAVTGYEYRVDSGSWVDNGTDRSADVGGLAPNTGYTVYARAYDAAGNRSVPISSSITTAEEPVTTPPASVARSLDYFTMRKKYAS